MGFPVRVPQPVKNGGAVPMRSTRSGTYRHVPSGFHKADTDAVGNERTDPPHNPPNRPKPPGIG